MVNASLADVEAKLKEVMASPEATAYKAKRSLDDWEQTQLIVDLENLLGKLATVCIAQQSVLVTMLGAVKQLNKK